MNWDLAPSFWGVDFVCVFVPQTGLPVRGSYSFETVACPGRLCGLLHKRTNCLGSTLVYFHCLFFPNTCEIWAPAPWAGKPRVISCHPRSRPTCWRAPGSWSMLVANAPITASMPLGVFFSRRSVRERIRRWVKAVHQDPKMFSASKFSLALKVFVRSFYDSIGVGLVFPRSCFPLLR